MRKLNLLLTLVALSLATSSLWAKPAVADENGKLPGVFTINSSCDMVYFSQGNLQAVFASAGTSVCTWKFADEQYQYIGDATANKNIGNNQVSSAGTVDLFCWVGASSSLPAYGINNAKSGYGSSSLESLKDEWGTLMGSSWRTLTGDEWAYLLNPENSYSGRTYTYRFAKAYLFGTTHGLIIFPDNYVHPGDVAAVVGLNKTDNTSWNLNQYNATDWGKMEAAGCVFLPAAGFRSEASVNSAGAHGSYWSTSPNTSDNTKAYRMYLVESTLFVANNGSRFYGYSVRLVKDVPPVEKKASVTSAPTAVPDLIYTGSAQSLVTAGTAQHGTLKYRLGDTGDFTTTIPTATNAGEYTVQYFVDGTGCFDDTEVESVNVTIAQADYTPSGSYSVTGNNVSYTGSAQALATLTGSVTDGTIWYKLGDGSWSTSIPTATDIGDYHVWYKIVPNDANYKTTEPVEVLASITIPTVTDHSDAATINAVLALNPENLKVKRTIYADDEYNTICLPFSLDESALAASPLAGFNRLKTFKGAQVTGTAPELYIDIFVEDATTIEAGIPYLITYPSAHADIVNPVFTGITVTTTEPSAVSVDGITFQGMFAQVHIDPYDAGHSQDYLFLGANSQLYWPLSTQTSSDIKMRGFRAYFIIDRNSISPALAPKGTRARIMDAPKTTTAIDNPSAKFGGSEKIIENGILYIIRNGVRYNAQGQIVK